MAELGLPGFKAGAIFLVPWLGAPWGWSCCRWPDSRGPLEPVSPHGVPGGDTGRAGQSGRYAETWGWPFGASRRVAWTPEGTEGSLQESVVQNSSATSLVRPCSGMGSVGPGRWVLCPSRGGLEVSLSEADTTGTPHGLGWGQATGTPRGRVSPRAAARFSGPPAFVILSRRHCLPGRGELRVSVGRCPAFLDLLPDFL